MTRRRRSPDPRGFPLVTVGLMWHQEHRDVWKRHLIRRYEGTGKYELTSVVYVEQNQQLSAMFCFRCFSQNIHEIHHRDWVWYHCQACDFEFRVE